MEEQKNTFNPGKNYKWEKDAEFKLNGLQFSILLQAHRAILRTEDAMRTLLVKESSDNLEKLLEEAVNSGVVKEVVPPGPQVEQPPLTLEKEKV